MGKSKHEYGGMSPLKNKCILANNSSKECSCPSIEIDANAKDDHVIFDWVTKLEDGKTPLSQ